MSRKSSKVSVVLAGFSGVGKTSIAKQLQLDFGWDWVDVDACVEKDYGSDITSIIRVEGEDRFRELEANALKNALSEGTALISIGGGALLREENRKAVEEHSVSVHLAADVETVVARVEADEASADSVVRPLLAAGDKKSVRVKVDELMKSRKGLYDKTQLKVWTDWVDVSTAAAVLERETQLHNALTNASRVVSVPAFMQAGNESDVEFHRFYSETVIGSGVRRQLAARVEQHFPKASQVVLLVDENVASCWGEDLDGMFSDSELNLKRFIVPAGESSKSFKILTELSEELVKAGGTRGDVIVGIGGGVLGDLAGLLASVFMRGMGLIHVPTTVVAQVDSAIGGKTAIDLEGGKNLIGTFYPARVVLSDLDFLSTLPDREYVAGLAEVVKYGLIDSEEFFVWLEENAESVLAKNADSLSHIVEFCSRAKLRYVVDDLTDSAGRRAKLNFGHTVGHAIEKLAGYERYLHGEAVSIGMIQALYFGELLKRSTPKLRQRAEKLLVKFNLPVELPEELVEGAEKYQSDGTDEAAKNFFETWFAAVRADKKRISKELNFVFVDAVGESNVVGVDVGKIVESIAHRCQMKR